MELKAIMDALEQHHSAVVEMQAKYKAIENHLLDIEQQMAGGLQGGGDFGGAGGRNALGKQLFDNELVKAFAAPGEGSPSNVKAAVDSDLLIKNTILGESGGEPSGVLNQADRMPGVVPGAFRSLNILDFLPTDTTNSNMVEYSRELSWTNDAAETAEGAQKPESDLTFEVVQDSVRTIAHWLKTSKQAWDDSPWLQSYLSDRLSHGIRKRLQTQLIGGNGTAPNLAGITSSGRHTAFTPTASETPLDALNRSKYEIEGGDYLADFVILNPADWGAIERQRRGSSEDAFTLGEGGAAGFVSRGMPPVVWDLPVIRTNDLPAGKFIMGSRDAMRLLMRQNATVEFFEQDDDNVQKNLITVRAELRATLAVMVPAAIRYGDLTA